MQDLDSKSVRIGRKKLAELLDKAAELLTQRRILAGERSPSRAERELDRALSSLHDELYSLALTPLHAVFAELESGLRSAGTGRRFGILTGGEGLQISASTAEALTPPLTLWLTHVLKNQVDSPEIRVLAGKPAQASLVLKARAKRQEFELTVMDDGNGFDPACPPAELAPLADAVRALGGTLEVRSSVGEGTGLVMRMPQSHEVCPGFVVELAGRKFVVPAGQLVEVISTRHYKVHSSTGKGRMIQHHGQVLPLYSLSEQILNQKEEGAWGGAGLVVECGGRRLCFVVDQILGSRPYAIRRTEAHGPVTVLAGGEIAPVLDLEALADARMAAGPADSADSGGHSRAA